jgi:ATP-binding cassette subfamily B protein
MFDVTSGSILIDGQDISKVTQSSLRDNISVIPQEPILFNRSILENIRYGKINATDDEVFEAAKKACIHDDIMNMQDKYETICGDKGSSLSGGQRQRVAIARAILKDSPILILDEATSALDTITEMILHDSLEFLMKDKTVLVIAHRLSTLKNMDRIIVFDNGKIVEDGTHDNLYNQGKLYRKFWDSQIGGFIMDND